MKKLLLASAFVLLLVSACSADSLSFNTLPPNTFNGVPVGNSTATDNTTGTTSQIMCDDYNSTTYFPSGPFDFEVSTLPSLQNVKFERGTPQGLFDYRTAAILLYDFDNLNPATITNQVAGDYNYAIWMIFDKSLAAPDTQSSTLLSDARSLVQAGGIADAYNGLRIYTPTGPAENQEFLGMTTGTPEPSLMLLVGSGLVGLTVFKRKRKV